ncbi:MAG: hypothetical protein ACTHNW_19885 [Mucilaginibacter sp.]
MSNTNAKPEEKGFFERIKESIENLWDDSKDNAEEVKDKAPEAPVTAKPHTSHKASATVAKTKAEANEGKAKTKTVAKGTASKVKAETAATKKVADKGVNHAVAKTGKTTKKAKAAVASGKRSVASSAAAEKRTGASK